jgi:hypothetical protein
MIGGDAGSVSFWGDYVQLLLTDEIFDMFKINVE